MDLTPQRNPEFLTWFAAVKAEAARRGVPYLIATAADHEDAFLDGDSPVDEVQSQIDYILS